MYKSFLLAAAMLYGTAVLAQQPVDNSPYAKTMRSFSKWYAGNAPDSIYDGLLNDKVKAQVSKDAWRTMLPQIKDLLGQLGDFTLDASGKGYVNYVAFGSDGSMGLVLSMDSGYLIQGIFPRQNPAKSSYHTNYKVHTPDGDLAGELVMPDKTVPEMWKRRKMPVVLIIAGSGPTDRNGNGLLGLKTDCYKQLADSLSKQGIASLRYDKRFVGESTQFRGRADSVRFENYVDDARTCIRQLRTDTNFSTVLVIGHSEGALIGAIASREEKVDGFVSLAGAGVPAENILKKQLAASGLDDAGVQKALDSLEKGHELYIASWTKYDPAQEIARLTMPVMIIQGLRDLQVSEGDAEMLHAALPRARLLLMDSMNHVLKTAPADRQGNLATYGNPGLRLYPNLVPVIVALIDEVCKDRIGCIYNDWKYRLYQVDDQHVKFVKGAVDSLMAKVLRCMVGGGNITLPVGYKDQAFEITLPADMRNVITEMSNDHFTIFFLDAGSKRKVGIHYDFNGASTHHLPGPGKKIMVNDRKMFVLKDHEDQYIGVRPLRSSIVVTYSTPDKKFEKELQEAVASFTFF